MITEDYVSFETANLLKEKGFDESTLGYYVEDKDKLYFDRFSDKWNSRHIGYIAAPTLQMAMKWLREVHKILILVEYDCPVFSSDIYKMDDIDECGSAKHIPPTFANCKNYEEACEVAIKHCLEKLI